MQFISDKLAGQSILRIPHPTTLWAQWGRALSSCTVNPSPTVFAKLLTMDLRMLFSYTAASSHVSLYLNQWHAAAKQDTCPEQDWATELLLADIEEICHSPDHVHIRIELLSVGKPILTSSANNIPVHWSHVLFSCTLAHLAWAPLYREQRSGVLRGLRTYNPTSWILLCTV